MIFKEGDVVICINGTTTITLGREYVITKVSGILIYMLNDSGIEDWFSPSRFKKVENQQEYYSNMQTNAV